MSSGEAHKRPRVVERSLWLIRHAPVAATKGVIHGPNAPADLSDRDALATLKAQLPIDCYAVCSPTRRTTETALALGLDPVKQPEFREQDFGAWTGKSHAELAEEPDPAYRDFWIAPADNAPPGGESFANQINRTKAGLEILPPGASILVVHSGTVRAVLAIALDLSPDAALRFVIDPLSLTRVDLLEGGSRIGQVNWRP